MAAFTNDGTGTLKSTTLEGAVAELFNLIQIEERKALAEENANGTLSANNLTVPDFIAIAPSLDTYIYNASAPLLPITASTVLGKPTFTATDYLAPITAVAPVVDNTFTAGNTGLVSTNKVEALLELIQLIQDAEAVDAEGDNNVTSIFNTDAGTVNVTAALPFVPSVNATTGKLELTMSEYLV